MKIKQALSDIAVRNFADHRLLPKLREELEELRDVIAPRKQEDFDDNREYRQKLVEEVADVQIMLAQLCMMLGLRAECEGMMAYKIYRTRHEMIQEARERCNAGDHGEL